MMTLHALNTENKCENHDMSLQSSIKKTPAEKCQYVIKI